MTAIEQLLADWALKSPDLAELAQNTCGVFEQSAAPLSSEVKYGGVLYSHSNQPVGGVFLYSAHVSVEFTHGAQLSAPDGVLQGKGKHRRHVKLTSLDELTDTPLADLIQQACALL